MQVVLTLGGWLSMLEIRGTKVPHVRPEKTVENAAR